RNAGVLVGMGMCVDIARGTVRGPACVADTDGRMDGGFAGKFFEVGYFPLALLDDEAGLVKQLRGMTVRRDRTGQLFEQRQTSRVIPAILESFQARQENGGRFPAAN